jgi:hypothetical protein
MLVWLTGDANFGYLVKMVSHFSTIKLPVSLLKSVYGRPLVAAGIGFQGFSLGETTRAQREEFTLHCGCWSHFPQHRPAPAEDTRVSANLSLSSYPFN